jgi:hypothetical protein
MTPLALMDAMKSLGVKLLLHLDVDAPRGIINPEHLDLLRTHRAALLVHLAREEQWAELRPLRWGPAVGDPEPGIVVT